MRLAHLPLVGVEPVKLVDLRAAGVLKIGRHHTKDGETEPVKLNHAPDNILRFWDRSFPKLKWGSRGSLTPRAVPERRSKFIIASMSDSPSTPWWDRSTLRLDRQAPYLRIFFSTVFVRDQDRSLQFYLDQLGFNLVADNRFEGGGRWVAVAPPDGSAVIALVTPEPGSEEYDLIGRARQVVFITEDIDAMYEEWRKRGVHFHHAPRTPIWGGVFTTFEDVDGNSFSLVGFDDVSREIEAQRRTIAEKLESERRAARNWRSQNRCRPGSSHKRCRPFGHSIMRACAYKLARSAAITTISSTWARSDSAW
jgi:predicted enzyme related to lactoylglutathione lyase